MKLHRIAKPKGKSVKNSELELEFRGWAWGWGLRGDWELRRSDEGWEQEILEPGNCELEIGCREEGFTVDLRRQGMRMKRQEKETLCYTGRTRDRS